MVRLAELFSVLILISAVLNAGSPFIKFGIKLYSFQSLMLALYTLMVALYSNTSALYLSFLFIILFKVVIIPYFLFNTLKRVEIKREIDLALGIPESVLFAGSLTLLSNIIAERVIKTTVTFGSLIFTISLATFLIGAMLMITRKTLFSQIIGFLTIDNAIFLAGNSFTHGMPLLVEFGVLFDLLAAVLILSLIIIHIKKSSLKTGLRS